MVYWSSHFNPYLLAILLGAALLAPGTVLAKAQKAPPANVQHTTDKLLNAIKADDYKAFKSQGNLQFKAAYPKAKFEKFSKAVSQLLHMPYKKHYLGTLKRKDADLYIYKLTFNKHTEDALVMTSFTKSGQLASMLFR